MISWLRRDLLINMKEVRERCDWTLRVQSQRLFVPRLVHHGECALRKLRIVTALLEDRFRLDRGNYQKRAEEFVRIHFS